MTKWNEARLRELFGNNASEYAIDKDGILVEKCEPSQIESVSFPSSSYVDNQVALNSWWVRARYRLILKYLDKHQISSLVEIGAGNGYVAIPLHKAGINVIGVEPLRTGAETLNKHGVPTFQGTFERLKLKKNSCMGIGAFDVIEHIDDDLGFLTSVYESLADEGFFVVTVPGHSQLYSDYDTSIGHFRRYSKRDLDSVVTRAGFKKVTSRYFFSSLVFPAFFIRRIPFLLGRRREFDGKGGVGEECEKLMQDLPRVLNGFLTWVLYIDLILRLPFGLSVFGVYQKHFND